MPTDAYDAMPTDAYDAICAAVLRRHHDRSDGALRAVLLDHRCAVLLSIAFEEGTGHVDELYLRHLVAVVSEVSVAAVVFAVLRRAGRPTRVDKLLWRELAARLDAEPTRLLDLLVIGETTRWSMAARRAEPLHDAA
jgi:DNA repair protein RadC